MTTFEATTASARWSALAFSLFLLGSVAASAEILQTFYVPLPEDQLAVPLDSISLEGPFDDIHTVISISASANNTLIYYDHWEDGYEADIENPVQSSTETWGDGNPANGSPPGLASDVINAGNIIYPENDVELPRNPAQIRYDGRDKMGATKPLAVTRAAWNEQIGTVLAGAVEVAPVGDYGAAFEIPIGEDVSDNQIFEHVGLLVMAASDGTSVQIDIDGNGSTDINQTLDEGEGYVVNGNVDAGATVTSSANIQVHLMTGDIGARYETRWFSIYPTVQWTHSYYSPVGTTSLTDPAHLYVYNPNGSPITVSYETQTGNGSFDVAAGGTYKWQLPMDSGAHVYTVGEQTFYALCTIDSDAANNSAHDWGFSLVSEAFLTPVALIGWGPGADSNGNQNGSPAWVSAVKPTTIYVDFDGDPSTGTYADQNGQRYDEAHAVAAFESLRLYDPYDNDQTGMRIYTVDRTLITAAWGQDPATAAPGNPFLDLGTTVPPLPVFSGDKDGALGTDHDSNGLIDPGDTIAYTIEVNNDGIIAFATVTVRDEPSPHVTYLSNSTLLDGAPVPDGSSGTPFPLDEAGYNVGGMQPGESHLFQYQMTVNAFPPVFDAVTNRAAIILDSEQNIIFVREETLINTPSQTDCDIQFTDSGGTPVSSYGENATVYVELDDGDQNDDAGTAETVTVRILNTGNGDRETLTLMETGVNTGIFLGSVVSAVSNGLGVEDGTLYALAGHTLQVDYQDPFFTTDTCSDSVIVSTPTLVKTLYLHDASSNQVMSRISLEGDTTYVLTDGIGP